MNEAEIRKYASLMRELDLTGIEIDEKQGVIRLERERDGAERGSLLSGAAGQEYTGAAAAGYTGAASPAYGAAAGAAVSASAAGTDSAYGAAESYAGAAQSGGAVDSVTSPTVGVFYAAPAENADPYVKVGDVVHKGTVLCIIEAMKLMNEVVSEKEGVIEAVCAQNGQIVEYGTELFRIKELSA